MRGEVGMNNLITDGEKQTLLRLAREAMEHGVRGIKLPSIDRSTLTSTLREVGASFVTLTIKGALRGCIGTLDAYQPLAEDVREHAVAAALQDPRFPQVGEAELNKIRIEVSRLTTPQLLKYSTSADLLTKLRPQIDGVILKDGHRRATFLPQVWEKIPDPADFLDNLCAKMGARANLWREATLQVYVYQVEEFHELN
jgi:AmmeMemoRadiSam system protein A